MLYLILIFSIAYWPTPGWATTDNTLNVYNWSNYLPASVITAFSRETGIKVNYSTYDSNEVLYAKLKANPTIDYDVIVPSTYLIQRMIKQGMLRKLDNTKLPNRKNLDPTLLNKDYDPGNQYSLPYSWSSTGIVVNTHYHSTKTITRWSDLWQSCYRDQLLLLNDMHEVFSIALMVLGYSANDTDPEHIKQAYLKLRQLMPNVKVFNTDSIKSLYMDEDFTLGMGWNGDIYQAQQENPALQFVYPKEGYILAIDSMAIPIGARHIDNAHKFINFVLRPEIGAKISLATGYASPNLATRQYLPKPLLTLPVLYPSTEVLRRSIVQTDVGSAQATYEHYWALLKIGG